MHIGIQLANSSTKVLWKGSQGLRMKTKLVLLMSIMAMLLVPTFASADSFNWSYNGIGVTASGQLAADLISPGLYHVTGMTGQRNGAAITGFSATACGVPPCITNYGSYTVDNLIYYPSTTNPSADTPGQIREGLAFTTKDGTFNVYYNDGAWGPMGDYEYTSGGSTPGILIDPFKASPVPEPSSVILLGIGLLCIGFRRTLFKTKA
jgi:hypothetical protein